MSCGQTNNLRWACSHHAVALDRAQVSQKSEKDIEQDAYGIGYGESLPSGRLGSGACQRHRTSDDFHGRQSSGQQCASREKETQQKVNNNKTRINNSE